MARTYLAVLLPVAVLAACSSPTEPGRDGGPDATPPGDVASSMDTPAMDDTPPAPDVPAIDNGPIDAATHERTLTIGPISLAPGQETTVCVLRRLGNMSPEYLQRIRATLSNASHHLIVYRSTETAERLEPFRCNGFSGITSVPVTGMIETPLLIAQNHEASLTMPAGVGMNLEANQMIRLEYHAVNVTTTAAMIQGQVWFDTVDRVAAIQPADVLFWGNVRINLPPRSTSRVHFFNRPWSGVRIFGLTSHTHQLGGSVMNPNTISVATNATMDSSMAMDIREVHRSTSWSEPPLTLFDPPLRLESGQGLHLVCQYNNTTGTTVTFGESVNREMCFMWAYYYPAPRGTQVCAEGATGAPGVLCLPP